jgi:ABC-type oligopeptide transport system ATPase subunit
MAQNSETSQRNLLEASELRKSYRRTGKFVEVGAAEQILRQPTHPYTRELLAAVPELLRA